MPSYKSLLCWQKAMLLVSKIYELTKNYPKEELFALTSQTKRAAISVPANIAEGCERRTKKDTLQFLYISRGSLYELETHLNIALMNNFIRENIFEEHLMLIDECLKLLNGLINKYETSSELK